MADDTQVQNISPNTINTQISFIFPTSSASIHANVTTIDSTAPFRSVSQGTFSAEVAPGDFVSGSFTGTQVGANLNGGHTTDIRDSTETVGGNTLRSHSVTTANGTTVTSVQQEFINGVPQPVQHTTGQLF
jgi:hypothetical protein